MIATTKKDIVWNYLGTILNLGMNLLILPFVLRLLTVQELGLWYVFGSVAALVHLMDFGFAPAIMRNISYAWSGAKELIPEGVSHIDPGTQRNYGLISSLLHASRKIYLVVSVIAGVLLLSVGSVYIHSLLPKDSGLMMAAWVVFSFATFFNLFYSYWSPMLRGIGKIKEINYVLVISRSIYVVLAAIGLVLGGGLLWFSVCNLILGLLMMLLSRLYFHKAVGDDRDKLKQHDARQAADILRTIWPNATKQGIVTIGAWLTTRASTLICSSFLGLEVTAQYGLSLQFITMIGGIASLLFSSYVPELASLKISNQKQRYIRLFSRAISVQWVVAALGILALTFIGPLALEVIGSNASLLPAEILLVIGAVYFLEWNHSTFATLITLSNTVPFVKSAVISGTAIVILALLSVRLTGLGILGLILSQGLVQLAYNNWHWPRLVLKENDISIRSIIASTAAEMRLAMKAFSAKR